MSKKLSLKLEKVSSLKEAKDQAATPEEQKKFEEEMKQEEERELSVES